MGRKSGSLPALVALAAMGLAGCNGRIPFLASNTTSRLAAYESRAHKALPKLSKIAMAALAVDNASRKRSVLLPVAKGMKAVRKQGNRVLATWRLADVAASPGDAAAPAPTPPDQTAATDPSGDTVYAAMDSAPVTTANSDGTITVTDTTTVDQSEVATGDFQTQLTEDASGDVLAGVVQVTDGADGSDQISFRDPDPNDGEFDEKASLVLPDGTACNFEETSTQDGGVEAAGSLLVANTPYQSDLTFHTDGTIHYAIKSADLTFNLDQALDGSATGTITDATGAALGNLAVDTHHQMTVTWTDGSRDTLTF